MTSGAAAGRREIIEPPSARREFANVLRVAMAVTIGMWMFVGVRAGLTGETQNGRRNFLPFQALIQDRPATEQRRFRELHEALLEAEVRRASTGAWPDVASLAADQVPPFAFDPTAKSGRYDWTLARGGAIVNYLGRPERADAPAWLLLVQEPEPGVPPDQNFEDEEHHRLSTGAMLHVSVWVHANGAAIAQKLVRMPQAEGWTQLYAVGPSNMAPPVTTF